VLGVEDRQERDGHQRGGGEGDAAVVEAHARPVDEADDERPDQRDDDARREKRRLGVGGEAPGEIATAAEPDREDRVQEVGQRGRVLVVARIQPVAEHPDGLGHEVLGLVGVERERQPVIDVPQPQAERHEQDPAQRDRRRAVADHRGGRGGARRRRLGRLRAHAAASRGPKRWWQSRRRWTRTSGPGRSYAGE
jgi:hypothetical protein